MKFLALFFVPCFFMACNFNNQKAGQEAKTDTSRQKDTIPVVVTERHIPFFVASGFEPMWNLELFMAQDGTYPVVFTTVTGKMTGTLRMITEDNFEGIVKGEGKESLLKIVITNTPCMREDGETKDPQTTIITYEKNTFSGCGRKLVAG